MVRENCIEFEEKIMMKMMMSSKEWNLEKENSLKASTILQRVFFPSPLIIMVFGGF